MKTRLTLERQPRYARTQPAAYKVTEKTVTVHSDNGRVRTVYWTRDGATVIGRLTADRLTTLGADYRVIAECAL